MPARGARTTPAASRTAAILQPGNAGPPCAALAMDFAPRTPTWGRPTGRAEAGILPARRGAIGAAIRAHSGRFDSAFRTHMRHPRVHHSSQEHLRRGWIAGSSPAMTKWVKTTGIWSSEPDPAYRDRNCGGLLAENPERTVAQPLGIALAILGKLDDCLRDRRRQGGFAVSQPEPGQRSLECRRQVGNVVRTKRVVVFEDRSNRHVQPCNPTPHVRRSIFYRGGVKD